MHGDVPRDGIVLQQIEHEPSGGIGEADIQRYSIWCVLTSQVDGRFTACGDQTLEAALVRDVEKNTRKGDVIFDNQQHPVAGLKLGAVVLDFHGSHGGVTRPGGHEQDVQLLFGGGGAGLHPRQIGWRDIGLGQV